MGYTCGGVLVGRAFTETICPRGPVYRSRRCNMISIEIAYLGIGPPHLAITIVNMRPQTIVSFTFSQSFELNKQNTVMRSPHLICSGVEDGLTILTGWDCAFPSSCEAALEEEEELLLCCLAWASTLYWCWAQARESRVIKTEITNSNKMVAAKEMLYDYYLGIVPPHLAI